MLAETLSFPYSLFLSVKLEPSSLIAKDHSDHSMKLELVGDYAAPTNETSSEFHHYYSTCPSTSKPWHPIESLDQGRHVD